MAKATSLKASYGQKDLGTFKIERFSLFEDDDLEQYAVLRNRANDASKGVKIENMREYSRKTTTQEGGGADRISTTTEEIILVVSYWEKVPKRTKGDSNGELEEAKKEWSHEH